MDRELIKSVCCRGMSPDEVATFLHIVERTGLDPLARQIYAVKRWDRESQRYVYVVQTGIDGYRLIADRTGRYAPGGPTRYEYGEDGSVLSATATVKKMTPDGTWHEVAATAYWSEYVATDRSGNPTAMWANKPHIMLAKCAEALALRRAFPAELSGLYTNEEMEQAGPPVAIGGLPSAAEPEAAAEPGPEPGPEPPKSESAPPESNGALTPPRRRAPVKTPPPAVKPPEQASPTPPAGTGTEQRQYISDAQRRRLWALAKSSGRRNEDISAYLREVWGVSDSRFIERANYDEICAWIMSPEASGERVAN